MFAYLINNIGAAIGPIIAQINLVIAAHKKTQLCESCLSLDVLW